MSKKGNGKKTEKKIKIALIILAILIIIIVITLSILLKKNKPQERANTYVRPETIGLISQDEFFKKYGGSVPQKYIMEKITDIVYYISDNKNKIDNMTNSEISKEYKNNEQDLKEIGFENEEDYKNIILEVKKIGTKEAELSYAEIVTEEIKRNNGYTKSPLIIKYVGLEKLKLQIEISNTNDTQTQLVRFKTINNQD